MYGTWIEVIDYSREMDMINVEPAFDIGVQPTLMRLVQGATKGEIIATIPLRLNSGFVDAVDYVASVSDPKNASITMFARATGTLQWYSFTIENTAALSPMLKATSVDIKIVLKRTNKSIDTPYFCDFKLRYALVPKANLAIAVDTPRNSQGVSLLDYGFDENFGTLQVNIDDKVQSLSNRDMIYYPTRNRWLEVTEVNPFQSVDTFIGMEATARFMQTYEPGCKVMLPSA